MATFASAAGTNLHYDLHGSGPLLVCHPGGPGKPASYLDTLGGVDRSRTLLLLDPRGVGGSAPADSYAYTELADDLEALRLHLGVGQFDLLAHSAGTYPSLTYAGRHPDRVGRLVLLTPPRRIVGPLDVAAMAAEARRHYGHEPWFPDVIEAFLAFSPDLPVAEQEALILRSAPLMYGAWTDAAQQHATRPADSGYSAAAVSGFGVRDFDPTALAKFANPVTVIAGDRDIFTGPTAPATIAGWFPDATLTWLPGAGHSPWIDAPEPLAAAIETALTRDPAPAR